MSKNLVLGTLNDDFIKNLSDYCVGMREIARLRKVAKEEITALEVKKQKVIDEREKLIEKGVAFVESDYSVVEFDNGIRAIENRLKDECEPINKARREIVKGLDLKEVYSAYFVGVTHQNYSEVGSVVKHGKKKDTIITTKKSFNNIMGKWFTDNGIKNAENEKVTKKFVEKYVAPFVGNKLDKNIYTKVAFGYAQFADNLIAALKGALVSVHLLIENEDGSLVRKNPR